MTVRALLARKARSLTQGARSDGPSLQPGQPPKEPSSEAPDLPDGTLHWIEQLVADKPGEGGLFHRQVELAEADAHLAALADEPHPTDRVLVLHAWVAMAQREWPEAINRWARVRERVPEEQDTAELQTAVALRESGDLVAAREAFAKLSPRDVGRSRYRREMTKLTDREGLWLATHLADRAVASLDQPGPRAHVTLLSAAFLTSGIPPAVVELLDPLTADMHPTANSPGGGRDGNAPPDAEQKALWSGSSADAADGARAGSRPGTPAVAIPSGLGWSGSGALTDYLHGFNRASFPFAKVELTCLRAAHGVRSVFEGLQGGTEAYQHAVRRFVLTSVLGVGTLDDASPLEARKIRSGSLLAFFESDELAGPFVSSCRSLFADLESVDVAGRGAAGQVERALREFFGSVFDLATPAGKVCVVNNCVNGLALHWLRLLPGARAYVMFRDPRDQFVAQVHEGRHRSRMDGQAFVKKLRRYYESVEAALADPWVAPAITTVQFEEFVLRPEVRGRLLEELGISPKTASSDLTEFDPEESRRNIGIHRTYGNREDIALIEREMADYLVDVDAQVVSR